MRRAMLVAFVALSACVVRAAPVAYADEEIVATAPPPPQVEVVGVAPGPGLVWIRGHWAWRGAWVWEPGRWQRGVPGRMWVEGHWERHRHGWRWIGGHW